MIPAIPHIPGEPFDGRCRRRKAAPPAKNGVRWYCRTQARHMDESPHCTAPRGLTQPELELRRDVAAAPARVVARPTRTGAGTELCGVCDKLPYGSTSRYSFTSHSVTSAQ